MSDRGDPHIERILQMIRALRLEESLQKVVVVAMNKLVEKRAKALMQDEQSAAASIVSPTPPPPATVPDEPVEQTVAKKELVVRFRIGVG